MKEIKLSRIINNKKEQTEIVCSFKYGKNSIKKVNISLNGQNNSGVKKPYIYLCLLKEVTVVKIIRSMICLLMAIFLIGSIGFNNVKAKNEETKETLQFEPLEVQVILERMYLDGEFSQETVKETIWSMEDFWAKYDSWQLIDMTEDKVVFREVVDDISPLLKSNGYFGINHDGALTIFNGRPQTSKIIHTFFQLDIGKLESKKHEQLKKGIPIKNKEQYVEVLETFKNFTLEEKIAN